MTRKRNLFDELNQGFSALAEQRAGKRTLRRHTVKVKAAPKVVRQPRSRAARGMF